MKRIETKLQVIARKLFEKAEWYGVKPQIFIALYLFSFLPFYGGIYLMMKGSGIVSVAFQDLIAFKFKKLPLNNEMLIWGFLINHVGWALPYLYVAIAGKRFKWYTRAAILFWAFLLIGWKIWKTLK